MKEYELILVDADETLFDFAAAERSALERTFRSMESPVPYEELVGSYHDVNKQLWKEVEEGTMDTRRLRAERFRRLFDRHGMEHSAEEVGEQFIAALSEGHTLLDGAEEFCRRWSARAPIIIVTNGIADVQRSRIGRSTVRPFIRDIVISEEVGASKPHAAMFDAAFRLAGRTNRSRVLMIGDSLTSDILGGMRYGIDTCWINPHGLLNTLSESPTYQVKSVTELTHGIT
jgi:2-haloacid dehalogenase